MFFFFIIIHYKIIYILYEININTPVYNTKFVKRIHKIIMYLNKFHVYNNTWNRF